MSGVAPLLFVGITDEAASGFIGVDRQRSLLMFSCNEDKLFHPWSQSFDNLSLIKNETHLNGLLKLLQTASSYTQINISCLFMK